jgi:hypothetical protein
MAVTVLDPALAAGDIEQVTGERREHVDPEVPVRARWRTFTAQYKLDVVAEYDAGAGGREGRSAAPGGPVLPSRDRVAASAGLRRAGWPGAAAGPSGGGSAGRADRPADEREGPLEQELAKARSCVSPLHTDPSAPAHSSLSQSGGSGTGRAHAAVTSSDQADRLRVGSDGLHRA